jgi:hypothetical protein
VLVHRGLLRTNPESLAEAAVPKENQLRRSPNHVRNFLDCVRSRERTVCPMEEAVQADTLCHLSDIAARLGRRLKFDPHRERFIRDDEANRRLALRTMRQP